MNFGQHFTGTFTPGPVPYGVHKRALVLPSGRAQKQAPAEVITNPRNVEARRYPNHGTCPPFQHYQFEKGLLGGNRTSQGAE